MDFAKKQLEKYGWSQGKGLGKQGNGIKEALKPKPKHGSHGIGFDISEEFTNHWWHKVYNNAADSIDVLSKGNGEILIKAKTIDDPNKKRRKRKNQTEVKLTPKKPLYGCTFIKTATLSNGAVEEKLNNVVNTDNEDDITKEVTIENRLTDEDLFIACGGRTAHKGARHGLKSNGKLARLKEQEMKFLQDRKLTECETSKTVTMKEKSSKRKKSKIL